MSGPWQVESVRLDRGTGTRAWIEVCYHDQRLHLPGVAALQEHLQRHGLDVGDLLPAGTAPILDDPDDGCE